MTPARQERKSRYFGAFLAAFSGTLTLAAAGLPSTSTGAATNELVVVNRHTGLAIDGFDPVAYFVDAAPKEGRAAFAENPASAIEAAEGNWPELQRTLVRD